MSTDRQDFQIWTISTSDYDRKIEFRGELILVYNEITKDTPVDKYKVSIKEEFTIPKGYKCKLHGGGIGSFARLYNITRENN